MTDAAMELKQKIRLVTIIGIISIIASVSLVVLLYQATSEPETIPITENKRDNYTPPNTEHYIKSDDREPIISEKLVKEIPDVTFHTSNAKVISLLTIPEHNAIEFDLEPKGDGAIIMPNPLQQLKQVYSNNIDSFVVLINGIEVGFADNGERIRIDFKEDAKLIRIVGFEKN